MGSARQGDRRSASMSSINKDCTTANGQGWTDGWMDGYAIGLETRYNVMVEGE
jgi:hypothetical protein